MAKIAASEKGKYKEFAINEDGTLSLSVLKEKFPHITGLRYSFKPNKSIRAVRICSGFFHLPIEVSWKDYVFYCVYDENKTEDEKPRKKATSIAEYYELDPFHMIVMGVPTTMNTDDFYRYFSKFGKLNLCELKKENKKGKNYGFIKFDNFTDQYKCITSVLKVGDNEMYLRLPTNKFDPSVYKRRILATNITPSVTIIDLLEYFSVFGKICEIFMPLGMVPYAFITFKNEESVYKVFKLGESHRVFGGFVIIEKVTDKKDTNQTQNVKDSKNNENKRVTLSDKDSNSTKNISKNENVTSVDSSTTESKLNMSLNHDESALKSVPQIRAEKKSELCKSLTEQMQIRKNMQKAAAEVQIIEPIEHFESLPITSQPVEPTNEVMCTELITPKINSSDVSIHPIQCNEKVKVVNNCPTTVNQHVDSISNPLIPVNPNFNTQNSWNVPSQMNSENIMEGPPSKIPRNTSMNIFDGPIVVDQINNHSNKWYGPLLVHEQNNYTNNCNNSPVMNTRRVSTNIWNDPQLISKQENPPIIWHEAPPKSHQQQIYPSDNIQQMHYSNVTQSHQNNSYNTSDYNHYDYYYSQMGTQQYNVTNNWECQPAYIENPNYNNQWEFISPSNIQHHPNNYSFENNYTMRQHNDITNASGYGFEKRNDQIGDSSVNSSSSQINLKQDRQREQVTGTSGITRTIDGEEMLPLKHVSDVTMRLLMTCNSRSEKKILAKLLLNIMSDSDSQSDSISDSAPKRNDSHQILSENRLLENAPCSKSSQPDSNVDMDCNE